MAVTVNLPADVAARLVAEAARRGVTADELAAQLIATALFKTDEPPSEGDAIDAFMGSGSSGSTDPFELRQARRDLANRKRAEGI